MPQYYLQLSRLYTGTGFELAQTLTSFFRIDWAPILFEKTRSQIIYNYSASKTGQKLVKLNEKTKNFISTVEASTQMFERMNMSLEVVSYRFTEPNKPDELFISAQQWRPVKTIWGEAAKHPLKPLAWEIKTFNANLDYVIMFYMGLFDCSPYMKTDEEKEEQKSMPVHIVLSTWGEISDTGIRTRLKEMLGNRFRGDICQEITEAIFKNANCM